MSVLCSDPTTGSNALYVKGAPEGILDRCTKIMLPDGTVQALTEADKKGVQDRMEEMARDALRTMAVAVRTDLKALQLHDYTGPSHAGHKHLEKPEDFIKVEQEMIFLGMIGIIDPPRPECKKAIEECRIAGISVIMITGDNPVTAQAIATNLGILSST